MQKSIFIKLLVFAMLLLFFGASVVQCMSQELNKDIIKIGNNILFNLSDQIDQYQNISTAGTVIYAPNQLAQSFKPTLNTLTYVKLRCNRLSSAVSGNLTISICSYLDGPNLTSITVPIISLPLSPTWVEFDFDDITVFAEFEYYIVFTPDSFNQDNKVVWSYGNNNPYDRGYYWFKNPPYDWYRFDNLDFCFQTYGYNVTNNHPNIPSDPNPADGATDIDINADLSWTCTDPDGDSLVYNVYFGTTSPPPIVATWISENTYDPGVMNYGTTYYWKIVAFDIYGASTSGPIWHFTTWVNTPPNPPSNPNPANGATGVDVNADLSWTCTDPDGDPLTYDVYFGTITPPPLVSAGQSPSTYDPGQMNFEQTYYWKIVAWDNHGASTPGPIWQFTTEKKPNSAPEKPEKPSGQTQGKINVEYTYLTTTTDIDGDSIYYNWSWGDGTYSGWIGPYGSGVTAIGRKTWNVPGTYHIKVKAKDIHGDESDWSEPLAVTMPRNKSVYNFIIRFFENHPLIFKIMQLLF